MPVLSADHFGSPLPRYQALLAMADLLVHAGDIPELFRELSLRLKDVVRYDLVNFCIFDPVKDVVRLNLWEGSPGPPLPVELPAAEAVTGWVSHNQRPMVFHDVEQETRFPKIMAILRERHLRSYCVLPLTSGEHRIGALGLASRVPAAYDEADMDFLQRVAHLVALAIANSLNLGALTREKERAHVLFEIGQQLASYSSMSELTGLVSASVSRVVRHDYLSVLVNDEKIESSLRVYQGSPQVPAEAVWDPTVLFANSGEAGFRGPGNEWLLTKAQLQSMSSALAKHIVKLNVTSLCCLLLPGTKAPMGMLMVGRCDGEPFQMREFEILRQVSTHLAIGLERDRAWNQIAELKDRLAGEKLYLEDEIRTERNFEQIIGESDTLKRTLDSAKTVAGSDANVLILGETGTGKELVARAIHNLSTRHGKSFIKVNCAAIPTGLLESELFGHERGAFTGALAQKIGRIELADGGTLFLDEVGDIPLELQPKLLRVLQDHEFERLGSTRTLKVNVRIVAATNRNIKDAVDAHQFRRDLYYRLNVFPLQVPPLRGRRKDIPLLVRYFVQRFSRRMNKHIETISAETMNALVNWDWPGNVRELENFLERSVILSKGRTLSVPVSELQPIPEGATKKDLTLVTAEREHILKVLRDAGGVVSGVRGAASRLGMKRTTLQSKMQKLGIRRQDYEN